MITGTEFLERPHGQKWEDIQELKWHCLKFFSRFEEKREAGWKVTGNAENYKIEEIDKPQLLHALNIFYKQVFDRIRAMEKEREYLNGE